MSTVPAITTVSSRTTTSTTPKVEGQGTGHTTNTDVAGATEVCRHS
jgi:hypothetical protein